MTENPLIQSDQITPAGSGVEIIALKAKPYPDQKRVRVHFRLTQFLEPPNATITLLGVAGEELASVEMVNISQPDNELTLHIPKSYRQQGLYQIAVTLFTLEERDAQGDEIGEVKLETQNLQTNRTTFTLQ